jgi:hypothetical protein
MAPAFVTVKKQVPAFHIICKYNLFVKEKIAIAYAFFLV